MLKIVLWLMLLLGVVLNIDLAVQRLLRPLHDDVSTPALLTESPAHAILCDEAIAYYERLRAKRFVIAYPRRATAIASASAALALVLPTAHAHDGLSLPPRDPATHLDARPATTSASSSTTASKATAATNATAFRTALSIEPAATSTRGNPTTERRRHTTLAACASKVAAAAWKMSDAVDALSRTLDQLVLAIPRVVSAVLCAATCAALTNVKTTRVGLGRQALQRIVGAWLCVAWHAALKAATAHDIRLHSEVVRRLLPVVERFFDKSSGSLKWLCVGVSITAQVALAYAAPTKIMVWWMRKVKTSTQTKPRIVADSMPFYFIVVFGEGLVVAVFKALQAVAPHVPMAAAVAWDVLCAVNQGIVVPVAADVQDAVAYQCVLVAAVHAAAHVSLGVGTALSLVSLGLVVLLARGGLAAPAAADVEGNPGQGSGAENPHAWVPRIPGLRSNVPITTSTDHYTPLRLASLKASTETQTQTQTQTQLPEVSTQTQAQSPKASTQADYDMLEAIYQLTVAQIADADAALAAEREAAAVAQADAHQREEMLHARLERVQGFGRRMIASKVAADEDLRHAQALLAEMQATVANLVRQLDQIR